MSFAKIGVLYTLSTSVKLLSGLIVLKIVSNIIGVDGLGQFGQFMSIVGMLTLLAGGGITNGVISLVAARRDNSPDLNNAIGAASLITVLSSLIIGTVLYSLSDHLSHFLFNNYHYSIVIKWLAALQLLIGYSNLLLAILNAHQHVTAFVATSILVSILGPIFIALGSGHIGIEGAMYGLMLATVFQSIFLLFWFKLSLKAKFKNLIPKWHPNLISVLLKFPLMMVTTALTMQLSQIIIRNHIETTGTWQEVGYWQASVKVSDAYLQLITVVLGNYYLPRLAELKHRFEIRKLVWQAFSIVFPLMLALISIIYIFKSEIILIVFSQDFFGSEKYIPAQLIGDLFKILSYLLGYIVVANARVILYVSADIFQTVLLLILTYLLTAEFSYVGVSYAYALTYFVYFTLCLSVFYFYIRSHTLARF